MLSDFFHWEALGGFIEKVGIPMTTWFVTIFVVYKLIMVFGVKIWDRFGPVIDAHFELIISMKDNLAKQTQLMEITKATIEKNAIETLSEFRKNHEALNEIREGQKEAARCLLKEHGAEGKDCGHLTK